MHARSWSTFLQQLCLKENEKWSDSGVWYHISPYCKYSEENCSSWGELTDIIKYVITLLIRTCEVQTTEDARPIA